MTALEVLEKITRLSDIDIVDSSDTAVEFDEEEDEQLLLIHLIHKYQKFACSPCSCGGILDLFKIFVLLDAPRKAGSRCNAAGDPPTPSFLFLSLKPGDYRTIKCLIFPILNNCLTVLSDSKHLASLEHEASDPDLHAETKQERVLRKVCTEWGRDGKQRSVGREMFR
ncbi:hypothetical protein ATANTOWER_011939 [Ataeniobius toweri]|uniref:Uncharacterized protein n=1 Tax=Ataeniobius toweri TaxID=208326 RepID=A0ABU7BY62_9TELE|nr:hypothetical protein [Ataeniobius toweri]